MIIINKRYSFYTYKCEAVEIREFWRTSLANRGISACFDVFSRMGYDFDTNRDYTYVGLIMSIQDDQCELDAQLIIDYIKELDFVERIKYEHQTLDIDRYDNITRRA